ncbi:MAG: S8 family peptidase [Niameybacter sp.]|uniref:S8 family peptidase n=1 Tax=Niameybacter sp. TaxID=2033640 RepID=UPI002FCB636C
MNLNKLSPLLQLALIYESYTSIAVFEQITGQNIAEREWLLIIQYYQQLSEISAKIPFTYEEMNDRFAIITIDKNLIGALSDENTIFYVELPRAMQYIAVENSNAVCAPASIYAPQSYNASGKGVLVAVIDSGIDYSHVDFRNKDGSTRILSLWDQSIQGTPPKGHIGGAYFTQEQIDEALRQDTLEKRLEIVPSVDILGHGTAVAGIAAGNGNGSGGQNKGIAPNADLLVVKMKSKGTTLEDFRGPTNADVMRGIAFALSEAGRLNKPLSLLLGVGLNEGAHIGYSNLEVFIDQMTLVWPSNMTVGTGNEANKERHTSGVVQPGQAKDIQIAIEPDQKFYTANLYKNYVDDMSFVIIAPNGEKTDVLEDRINNVAYVFGNTSVLINVSIQPFSARTQELVILLEGYGVDTVDPGIWTIRMIPNQIVDGGYNVWATVTNPILRPTRFLEPDPFTTLTIPSTGFLITSVSTINGRTLQTVNASGRGYTADERVKPDIAAPGLNLIVPQAGTIDKYTSYSGSSIAGAFVCGAYALFIEYGLRVKPESYLYGEALKGLVIKYAKRPMQFGAFPNQAYGYGILCITSVLDALERIYNE